MTTPVEVNPQLLASSASYTINQSLRLRSSASAMFYRTYGTPTDARIFTWSCWVKRGNLPADNTLFGNTDDNASSGNFGLCRFTGNALQFTSYSSGYDYMLTTTQVFRDVSNWYHIIVACDSSQATDSNRVKIYVNGSQVTAFSSSSYPAQNHQFWMNSAVNNFHGCYYNASSGTMAPFDGYFAELNFIDGQQLTPSSLGQTDSSTGVWVPKQYTGTYGNNGFYMKFSDASSTTNLVKDFSGRGNNMIPSNISLTAGTTYDGMKDSPTLSALGSNYCVWNTLDKGTVTVTNGNLSAVAGADVHAIRATMALPLTGKWYWETTVSGLGYGSVLGIADGISSVTTGPSSAATRTYQWGSWFNSFNSGVVQYGTNQAITGGTNWSGASQLATNDVLMIAVDMDNGSMWVGKNGTWFNSSGTANPATNTDPRWTGLGGTTWFPYYASYGSTSPPTANINFGQRPFSYTPPTGFKELNAFNLPTPTIGATASSRANKYFDAITYTGNGSSRSITGLGFQPDFVWIKSRSNTYYHRLADAVRGVGKEIYSNATDNETTNDANGYVSAFNSDGFSFPGGGVGVNGNTLTYVAWNWNAGGSTVTNNSGSISSQVRANQTAGFSVVTYTGNGSGGATVGHGLGVAPKMIIVKRRDTGVGATNWPVYHARLNNGVNPAQYYIFLNLTNGFAGASSVWNDTAPTSSVFSLGTYSEDNGSGGTFVAYCFAEIADYSAFGSYTGNGSSDGPFVFTGFRPRYVLVKRTDTTANWTIRDTARNPYNSANLGLFPNLSAAEDSTSGRDIDILSNGFKIRGTDSDLNTSSGTYIYAAFAETPFKYANAR